MKKLTKPLLDRFMEQVTIDASGCWLWTGNLNPHSHYAQISTGDGRRHAYAHRVAHELFIGPIPDGMQVDHLCRVRHCVNPAHLEAVTPLENNRRAGCYEKAAELKHAITHCKRGHVIDGYDPTGKRRFCTACRRIWSREYRRKQLGYVADPNEEVMPDGRLKIPYGKSWLRR